MLKHFQEKVQKYAYGKLIIIFLVLLLTSIIVLNFSYIPFSTRQLNTRAEGEIILDARFYYTPDELYTFLDALEEKGRRLYCYLLLADFILPLISAIFGIIFLAYILNHITDSNHPANHLIFLPVITLVSDYMENICIFILIYSFPHRINILVRFASSFTIIKALSGIIWFIAIIVCVSIVIYQYSLRRSEI